MADSRRKSLVKTVSWRIFCLLTAFAVAWLFTASVSLSAGVSLTYNAVTMVVYYFHERLWTRISL